MLRLTDAQLDQVMSTARAIPQDRRDEYLQRVAEALQGRDFGDGDVFRACAAARTATMWSIDLQRNAVRSIVGAMAMGDDIEKRTYRVPAEDRVAVAPRPQPQPQPQPQQPAS